MVDKNNNFKLQQDFTKFSMIDDFSLFPYVVTLLKNSMFPYKLIINERVLHKVKYVAELSENEVGMYGILKSSELNMDLDLIDIRIPYQEVNLGYTDVDSSKEALYRDQYGINPCLVWIHTHPGRIGCLPSSIDMSLWENQDPKKGDVAFGFQEIFLPIIFSPSMMYCSFRTLKNNIFTYQGLHVEIKYDNVELTKEEKEVLDIEYKERVSEMKIKSKVYSFTYKDFRDYPNLVDVLDVKQDNINLCDKEYFRHDSYKELQNYEIAVKNTKNEEFIFDITLIDDMTQLGLDYTQPEDVDFYLEYIDYYTKEEEDTWINEELDIARLSQKIF